MFGIIFILCLLKKVNKEGNMGQKALCYCLVAATVPNHTIKEFPAVSDNKQQNGVGTSIIELQGKMTRERTPQPKISENAASN